MKEKYQLGVVLLHLVFWILIAIVPMALILSEDINVLSGHSYVWFMAGPILFYVNYSLLVPKLLLKKKIYWYLIVSVVFLFLFNYLSYKLIPPPKFEDLEPLRPLGERLPRPKGMRFALPLTFSLAVFLLGGIFAVIIGFFEKDRTSKQFESERKEMELQFLRTQLNPHFLFNTLNSIYSLVRSKSNDAPEALITLSELMRYMLYEVSENKVDLEKELNYLQNYMLLQRLRLLNSEAVKLQIHGDTKGLKIYPLILITFIENAFKYGTDFKGNTRINITITIIDDELRLNVKNIIGYYKKDLVNSGVGLKNVNNQLDHFYNHNHTLSSYSDNGYYNVDLTLKLI